MVDEQGVSYPAQEWQGPLGRSAHELFGQWRHRPPRSGGVGACGLASVAASPVFAVIADPVILLEAASKDTLLPQTRNQVTPTNIRLSHASD